MDGGESGRVVQKAIRFSPDEWRRVLDLMEAAGTDKFSNFARKMILDGEVIVNTRPMDARRVRAMLFPIKSNVEQIARRVNIDDILYLEDLQEIRALMEQAVGILDRYEGTVEPLG